MATLRLIRLLIADQLSANTNNSMDIKISFLAINTQVRRDRSPRAKGYVSRNFNRTSIVYL